MLVDQPEAPPRSYWRISAFAVGCLLLSVAPAILTAFDEAIDRGLHLSDAWPDFWTLLAQLEAWWFGGVVLGAALIGGRVLVNRLRERSKTVCYLMAAVVWWLLLAVAPIILGGAISIFRVNYRLGNPEIGSDIEGLFVGFALAWLTGVALLAVFVGGRKLAKRPRIAWYLIGNMLCGLSFVVGPVMLFAAVDGTYRGLHHTALPQNVRSLLANAIGCLYAVAILFAAFIGARRLLIRYVRPESALYLMIVAAGWIFLAMVPPFLIGVALVISGRAHVMDPTRELLDQIAILCFGVVIVFAAFRQGRVAGHGDVHVGLGDAPVSNRVFVNSLAAACVAYAVLVRLVFHNAPRGLNSQLLIIPGNPAHNLYVFFLGLCLAPLSEELFLRGWMWTALRKNWDVQSTAMLTGGIWLLAHLANGVGAPFILIPVAIILSATRHVGQSVRAPIVIHAGYNLTILLLS